MRRRLTLALSAVTVLLTVTGCAAASAAHHTAEVGHPGGGSSGVGSTSNGSSGAPGSACSPGTLKTKSAGSLTVATDSPAYAPWFVDDKPANGKGYESAVAFAVGKQLGFPASKVRWVVAPFNSVIAPTPKKYDFDVNQVSITGARAKAVDFSSGYYDVAQAVVTLKSDKYAHATTVAALHGARLGAQRGSTSFDAINNTIKPGRAVLEYPTNDLAVQALKNGTIDGLVVDLPTGLYVTAAQIKGAKIVGQLPVTGKAEQFGLVLEKGSPLTSCVTKAVDALRSNGTLRTLQRRWLTTSAGAPELK